MANKNKIMIEKDNQKIEVPERQYEIYYKGLGYKPAKQKKASSKEDAETSNKKTSKDK